MSPYVKRLIDFTGESTEEIEKLWKQAKSVTEETFGISENEFKNREYTYTEEVVKNMLGLDESLLNPVIFLGSEKGAKTYIETMVSGDVGIDHAVIPPDEPEAKDDEEEELEYKIDKKKLTQIDLNFAENRVNESVDEEAMDALDKAIEQDLGLV